MIKSVVALLIFNAVVSGVPLEPATNTNFAKFFSYRIVGGTAAPDGSAPYMAALVFGTYRYFMCGGFIVSTNCVVTAAHCIDPFVTWTGELIPSLRVIVGSNVWAKGSGVAYEVEGYRNHPDWDRFMIKNDVGVFFMKTDIELNARTKILSVSFNWIGANEETQVTGWGFTNPMVHKFAHYLQLLRVRTISHEECDKRMLDAVGEQGWAPPVSKEIEMCTLHSFGHGMCNGDSGSPLILVLTGEAVGVVSWGLPCAMGAPDVFTRFSGKRIRDFLKPILEKCRANRCR